MTTLTVDTPVVIQNMGLFDRLFRLTLGIAMFVFAYYFVVFAGSTSALWDSYAMLIAIYPILTGALGWDPFYAMFKVKSCSITGRNRCGTLPYEFKAMAGHAPEVCEIGSEHSLESCHDAGVTKPHHKFWRVNQDPMIYPDDDDWDEYLKRMRDKEVASK